MAELICRSKDYSTLSVKVLRDYEIPTRKEGTFDRIGYNPSKEFVKMKKEIVKQEEITNKRKQERENIVIAKNRIRSNSYKLARSIESFLINKSKSKKAIKSKS